MNRAAVGGDRRDDERTNRSVSSTPASKSPGERQTSAFLRRRFSEVGFTLDLRRGQNFLVDLNLLDSIERLAAVRPDDIVLEVGAGTGSLTARLVASAGRVVSVEIDRRLAQLARESCIEATNLELIEGDVLAGKHRLTPSVIEALARATADLPNGRLLLVANLPYCVATPVIANLLGCDRPFDAAIVTVQKEVADRMVAKEGSRDYGALSVWIRSQCTAAIDRVLPPTVFWPRPKVDSAIVRIDLDHEKRSNIEDLAYLQVFLREVFCHRRKAIRGTLVRLAGGKDNPGAREFVEGLEHDMALPVGARPESIDPDRFVRLAMRFRERLTESSRASPGVKGDER
ncbi:MAG: 16S rRNA (adenine(1518)-N(6)/adenine(1519)-N(6))-dimethyltransferase RsmA [Planctomycetaceae bacterium]